MRYPTKSRPAVAGIIAGLLVFVMLFTVGTGYFIYQAVLQNQYDQVNSNNQQQVQQKASEQLTMITGLSASNILVTVSNTGGVPVVITGVFMENQTRNNLVCMDPKNGVSSSKLNLCSVTPTLPIPVDIGVRELISINSGQAISCSYSTPPCTIGLITQRGNVFTQSYPIPPAPFASTSNQSLSAPIGDLSLNFSSYKYYRVAFCSGSSGPYCLTSQGQAFTIPVDFAKSNNYAFSVSLTNVNPTKPSISVDPFTLMSEYAAIQGVGGGTAAIYYWYIVCVGSCASPSGNQILSTYAPIPLRYNIPVTLYFASSQSMASGFLPQGLPSQTKITSGTIVSVSIVAHGWKNVPVTSTPNYGQNIPFVSTLYGSNTGSLYSTAVACTSPVTVGSSTRCTATVTGVSPTGTVTFTQTGGGAGAAFTPSSGTCTLSAGSCSVTYTQSTATTVTITAVYSGDSNNPGSSGIATVTFAPVITLNPTSGPTGTSVNVAGAGFAPTSTVTIRFNGVVQTTSPATITTSTSGSFSASFMVPASAAGTYMVTATDGTNTASAQFVVILPSITLSPPSGPTGTSVTVSGTGFAPSSTITATFAVNPVTLGGTTTTDATGSFSGATFTVPASALGAQTVTVTDSATNSASATFTVTKPASTTVVSCTSPVTVGTMSTCTITVTGASPTGIVDTFASTGSGTFDATSCTLVSGSCSVHYTPTSTVGSPHLISATYEGDANNAVSTATGANRGSVTVNKAGSTTTVTCSPNPLAAGATTTCTATVTGYGTPTGTVTFSATGSSGTVTWSPSSPTCTLVSGSCSVTYKQSATGTPTITATYGGDPNNLGSSGTSTVTFSQATTTTSVSCAPSSIAIGSSTTCTATVTGSGPTGTVTWTSTGGGSFTTSPCTLAGGSCSVSYTQSTLGSPTITATYGGDPNNLGSSGSTTVTFIPRTTTTTVSCSPSPVAVGASTTCTATVTDTSSGTAITPSGTVTFSQSPIGSGSFSTSTCTLSGSGATATCSVTYTPSAGKEGTITITASYAGDTSHSGSSGPFSLTAIKRTVSMTISCSPASVTHSPVQTATCTVTVTDTSPGTPITPSGNVAVTVPGGSGSISGTCTLSGSGATATCSVTYTPPSSAKGSVVVTAQYVGDTDHTAPPNATFTETVT